MNRFKLGIVLETTGLAPRSALAAAAKLGVQGIEAAAIGDLAPERLSDTGRREFRTVLRGHALELAALRCPLRRGLDVAEGLQPRLDRIRQAMQLAYDLGARRIVLPLFSLPRSASDEPASNESITGREALTTLARFGETIGTSVALEVGTDPGNAVREYLQSFDTGRLRVTFDPANYLMNKLDVYANLLALNNLIDYMHARDARSSTISLSARETPVGAGDLDWMAYMATLEAIDYRGYLCIDRETGDHRFQDVANGVQFLRRFIPAPPM